MKEGLVGRVAIRLVCMAVIAVLAGLVTGHYELCLALGLGGYLAWQIWQLLCLIRWLETAGSGDPVPEASGLWGEAFDRIHHLQRRNREARRSLEVFIQRVQDSTSVLRDAIAMLDAQGNLEWWNPAASRLLGLKSPQDRGQPIRNLVRYPRFNEYVQDGDFQDVLELPSPVDERIILHIQVTLYGNGSYLLLARDASKLVRLEQVRKDFVANVSHDLRTPLTVLRGYLETLRDYPETPADTLRAVVEKMLQQSGRMQLLLDDLLLLARLESSDQPAESGPVVLQPLLTAICSEARALSGDGHQIVLETPEDAQVNGSAGELSSAFANLVFNAVKYTPSPGNILVWVEVTDKGVSVTVQDDGPGIDAKHIPRLTERFYRVEASRASATGGTGLGLSICKHVMMRHGGTLEIESTPGKGSVFTCRFPIAQR